MFTRYITIIGLLLIVIAFQSVAQTDRLEDCNADCQQQTALLVDTLSIVPEENRPIVICASGVGGVECEYRFESPGDVDIFARLCEREVLDAETCESVAAAQSFVQIPATCSVLLNYNIERAAMDCSDIDRNQACYAASTLDITPETVFEAQGEIRPLTPVVAAHAQSYNLNEADYGMFFAHADANIHRSVGAGLRILVFGDIRMENGIRPQDANILLEQPLSVTVSQSTSLHNQPSSGDDVSVLGTVAMGDTLEIDGLSADSAWARVLHMVETSIGMTTNAWIPIDALTFSDNIDTSTLPGINPDAFTPMQAFYFTPLDGTVLPCAPEYNSRIVLQAPRGIETSIISNGARFTMTDTVELKLVESLNNADEMMIELEVQVVSGVARVNTGTEDEQVIPAGYAIRIELDAGLQNYGADGVANDYTLAEYAQWSVPFALSRGQISNFDSLEALPLILLNQPINAPECDVDAADDNTCTMEFDFEEDAQLIAELCDAAVIWEELSLCHEINDDNN